MSRLKKKVFREDGSGGFTMVEIIVALAILSTSMLAVFGTLRMCSGANSSSWRLGEAVLLAERLLAEAKLKEKVTYQKAEGSDGIFSWEVRTVGTGMDNLAAVGVKVGWLNEQKPQEYRLNSLMHITVLMEGK